MTSPETLQYVLEEARKDGLSENVAYIIFAKTVQQGIANVNDIKQMIVNEKIKSQVMALQALIDEHSSQLKEVRLSCIHPVNDLEVDFKANTGNLDPNDNTYWKHYNCTVCGSKWTEES